MSDTGRTSLARMSCRIRPHIHAHALLVLISVLCPIVWRVTSQTGGRYHWSAKEIVPY